MSNQLKRLKRLVIQAGHHLRLHLGASGFDKFLLIVAGISIIAVRHIADFLASITDVNSWVVGINIYRLTFLILIYALRVEFVAWLGATGFRVVYYLLCNHFIDLYLGYEAWSINDTLTVILVYFEAILGYFGRRRVLFYFLYLLDTLLGLIKNFFV